MGPGANAAKFPSLGWGKVPGLMDRLKDQGLDSPFVRRAAASLHRLDLPFAHLDWSVDPQRALLPPVGIARDAVYEQFFRPPELQRIAAAHDEFTRTSRPWLAARVS